MIDVDPWSYSRAKAFETCPKQFYHTKILKEYPQPETEAMRYGTDVHLACEEYICSGKEMPKKYEQFRGVLDALNAKPGTKYCEYKMGLTADLEPCEFDAEYVWYRGIADLLIVDNDRAWVVDYKTGKSARYADTGQLELMALSVFKHFPEVKTVSAGLLFLVSNNFIKAKYDTTDSAKLWQKWLGVHAKMVKAAESGVWNPNPSGLCRRHCPVTECAHHGGY